MIRHPFTGAAIALALTAGSAAALEGPALATLTGEHAAELESLTLPVGPWSADGLETVTREGRLRLRAWRVPQTSRTALQILAPMRAALVEQGFEVLYDCADRICGGFDFRYRLQLLPEPEMHVDLSDFHYLVAERDGALTSILVSRSATGGHIHISELEPVGAAPVRVPPPAPIGPEPAVLGGLEPETPPEAVAMPATEGDAVAPDKTEAVAAAGRAVIGTSQGSLVEKLQGSGRVVLADLAFPRGSSKLEERVFPTLVELAAYLNAAPEARVVLVGHSDAEGTLETNVALSRRRAESVAERLIAAHGVAPGQLRAEGVGYLAPLTSNRTEDGRALNRRVEAVKAETE